MIAAIFCPGPSLLQILPTMRYWMYGATWAVNSAAKVMATDWLSAGDKSWYRGLLGEIPRPRVGALVCPDATSDARAWVGVGLAVVDWIEVPFIGEHQRRGKPINYSMQAALCHAAVLGATAIDLFGCDLAGREDCTGYLGEDRNDDRWRRERAGLEQTTALLSELGITVRRIAP